MAIDGAFGLPPEEALKYFRGKGLVASFSYLDVQREEHAAALTVAKMTDLDLLADTRAETDRALAEGLTFEQYKKTLMPRLQARGWWGQQTVTDPETGKEMVAELGSSRRLQTIFQTNLSTAYAAGNWSQVQDNAKEAPYLMYDAVLDDRTRPEHRAWSGTVLRIDDPWWDTHTPPCGYNCRCSTVQMSGEELQRRDMKPSESAPPSPTRQVVNSRTGETFDVPQGVDPGFDYNPGKLTRDVRTAQVFADKIAGADADLGAAAYYSIRSKLQPSIETMFGAWARTVFKAQAGQRGRGAAPDRKWQILGVMNPKELGFLRERGVAPVTAEIAVEDSALVNPRPSHHHAAGELLTQHDWETLPRAISNPEAVLYDTTTGHLVYVYGIETSQTKVIIEPELQTRRPKRGMNAVAAAVKVPAARLRDARYTLIRGELKK